MLSKVAGASSVLYFIYTAYVAIATGGLYGIMALLYYLPYPIAGILLLKDEHRMITILCGIAILFVPFYLSGYNVSMIINNLASPVYLVFSIALPALIIYSAIKG